MQHTEKAKVLDRWRFDSFGEFVEFAEKREGKTNTEKWSRKVHDWDRGWAGTATFEQAVEIANTGWEEGTKKVKALSEVLMDKVTSLVVKTTIEYAVTGNDFDIPMFLAGEPEHWYTQVEHLAQGKGTRALKLVYNCSASAGVSTDVITAKGAAIAALVECLEFSGFRVELELAECSRGGYTGYTSAIHVPLKAADQPLDMDRLSFALAHPATLRRLVFGVVESSEQFMTICGTGYGQPHELPKEDHGDIYIDKSFLGEPQWENVESTVAWLLKSLQEQGVQVEGLQEVPA